MDKRQELYFRREREKLKRDQRLLKIGKWLTGYLLPNGKIIVSSYMLHNDMLEIMGIDSSIVDERGGARLVLDYCEGEEFKKHKLTVDVYVEHFEKVRSRILNFIPFYKYVKKVVFEVIGSMGGVKRYSESLLGGEEKGFSLLNPKR